MVDSFKGLRSGERSLESQDSCRGIDNSLEELLFSFERPGRIDGLGSEMSVCKHSRSLELGHRFKWKLTQTGLSGKAEMLDWQSLYF